MLHLSREQKQRRRREIIKAKKAKYKKIKSKFDVEFEAYFLFISEFVFPKTASLLPNDEEPIKIFKNEHDSTSKLTI